MHQTMYTQPVNIMAELDFKTFLNPDGPFPEPSDTRRPQCHREILLVTRFK